MTEQPKASRESFFALYWDHARNFIRETMVVLAKVPLSCVLTEWDELEAPYRDALRTTILEMMQAHDNVRADAARRREVQGVMPRKRAA